jgi:viologen exporter family transport system permease protein
MNANVITKYTWISYTAIRSNLAYLGEVLSRTTFMAVILYTFMRLWTVVYSGTGTQRLGGLTLQQMIWYMVLTESMVLSSVRVSMEVDEDVRTGRIAVQLLRPMSFSLSRLAQVLGERSVRFIVNLLIGALIATLLVGPIAVSPSSVAMLALVLPSAFVLDFLGYFGIGLCAFWLESTTGLALIYSRLSMLVGGVLLPMEVFPQGLQAIARWLPFAGIIYGPARVFVSPDKSVLLHILATQAIGLIVLGTTVWSVQRMAITRIQSNGG